ncbi:MAG: sigma-70 family RNA polymerase sigma factor [Planctomycetota bacterium]
MAVSTTALLPRVAEGDPDAVQGVLDRYGSLVWTLVLRGVRDRSLAEDLVQEIFIDVWRSAARYRSKLGSEATFITTIARRRLIDQQRKKARRPEEEPVEEIEIPQEHEAFEGLLRREEAERALSALSELVPEQRRVLLLSIREGLSHSQIAELTGLPLGTVKTYIRRGLARVSEILQRGEEGKEERP